MCTEMYKPLGLRISDNDDRVRNPLQKPRLLSALVGKTAIYSRDRDECVDSDDDRNDDDEDAFETDDDVSRKFLLDFVW